jgi:hypothetical protein
MILLLRPATPLIAGQIGQARLGKVRRSIAVFSGDAQK